MAPNARQGGRPILPSGTMSNQVAILAHARTRGEVIGEATRIFSAYELGGLSIIAGLYPRPLPGAIRGYVITYFTSFSSCAKAHPDAYLFIVTEMPLVVVRPRKDIHALCGTIPVILRIGQVQTGGPNFNMVILGRTGRTLVRRWGNSVGVSLHGREQLHAVPITGA